MMKFDYIFGNPPFQDSKNRKKTQTSRDIKNATKKHTTLKSVSRIYTTHASHTRERKRNAERFLPTFASSIQSNETHASLYCVSTENLKYVTRQRANEPLLGARGATTTTTTTTRSFFIIIAAAAATTTTTTTTTKK